MTSNKNIKIIHTSDWHLGKRLYTRDRTANYQAYTNWLLDYIENENVDYLLIAGDVFDTFHPPHDAIDLFYSFLKRLQATEIKHCYIIAGNHDSGFLLEIPNHLVNYKKITIVGSLGKIQDHHIATPDFQLTLLPFFRTAELNNWKSDLNLKGDLHELESVILEKFFESHNFNDMFPKILMGHHLFGDFEMSGSEHFISLSGVDTIDPKKYLKDYDYLALGHIHKYQKVSSLDHYYSGSPYPLRFSETERKTINLIEIDDSQLNISRVDVPIFENLINVKVKSSKAIEEINKLRPINDVENLLNLEIFYDQWDAGLIDTIEEILKQKEIKLVNLLRRIGHRDLDDQSINHDQMDDIKFFNLYLKEEMGIEKDTVKFEKLNRMYLELKNEVIVEKGVIDDI